MLRKENILLVAYACDPKKSSEHAVGWTHVIGLSRRLPKINFYVLTRKKHQNSIEEIGAPDNVSFLYYDLPIYIVWVKNYFKLTRIYYYLWVIGAGLFVRSKHIHFSLIHHLTFVSDCAPSPALFIKTKNFIWGPIGSNGYVNKKFFTSTKNYVEYTILWLFKVCLRLIDPLFLITKAKADIFIGINEQTKGLLSLNVKKRFIQLPAISISKEFTQHPSKRAQANLGFTCLSIGKFIDIKNQALTLDLFCEFLNRLDDGSRSNCRLLLIGKGPNLKGVKKKAEESGFLPYITFIDEVSLADAKVYYSDASVVIHPTLENAGYVFLEAMITGKPVLGLNTGGAKSFIVSNTRDQLVDPSSSYDYIVQDFTNKLHAMYLDSELRNNVGAKNRIDALNLHSDIAHVQQIVNLYQEVINEK